MTIDKQQMADQLDDETRTELGGLFYDLLKDEDWDTLPWSEWIEWAECENEPGAALVSFELALGLTDPDESHEVTRADLVAACGRLGLSLEARDRAGTVKQWELRISTYQRAANTCGDNPRFAIAKAGYLQMRDEAIAARDALLA